MGQNHHADLDIGFDLTYVSNLLSSWYPNWFPRFTMPTIVFNPQSSHIFDLVCDWVQREPIEVREYYMPIHQSDHNTGSNNCHLINHFPTSKYGDSCFTSINLVEPIDLYDPSFHYLNTCQIVQALYLLLMVMSGPHNLEKVFEQYQIKSPSQDCLCNSSALIEISSFQ